MALDGAAAQRGGAAERRRAARPDAVEDAARGILAIVDNNMVGAIRVVSVERGHDPRDFALVPFGGAGPLHGCSLAALLGISRIMIPPAPGVLCADGLLAADLKAEFSRTLPKAGPVDLSAGETVFATLDAQAADWFAGRGRGGRRPGADPSRADALPRPGRRDRRPLDSGAGGIEAAFAEAHQALYGFTLNAGVEVVTLRVEATGRMPRPRGEAHAPGSGAAPGSFRRVHVADGWAEVPVYDRDAMGPGDSFIGPAIITQLDATTLVAREWSGAVHSSGAILLTAD